MRWSYLIWCCLLLTFVRADPDPKKYKSDKEKINDFNKNLTNEERKFLREVEEKFGVKSVVPIYNENNKNEGKNQTGKTKTEIKLPFPAVIAIEIVNDTDSKSKGKRTIDANLGYGYKTNEGYSYTYFGKSAQDKGKYMVYPYSQNDIPPSTHNQNYAHLPKSESSEHAVNVEIQPSQAYELVEVKDEQNGYDYKRPANPLNTKYEEEPKETSSYDIERPSQTLYTTYNGQEFSGLSKQFPSLMSNYFSDSRQLLDNTQYQSSGLAQDHLHSQSTYTDQHQRVVPVLVLRVPSSYLKNPTAELYADLPKNYPVSRYLNNVNLQDLVNQYFKKSGFSFAPQIMTYPSSLSATAAAPQHYANSYVTKPKYTYSDYSGIQYSAVKPTVARYPSNTQQKYVSSLTSSEYQPSVKYQYQYQYDPQAYYLPSQYQSQTNSDTVSSDYQNQQIVVEQEANGHDTTSNVEYQTPQHSTGHEGKSEAVEYESEAPKEELTQPRTSYHASGDTETSEYQAAKSEDYSKPVSSEYGPVKVSLPAYDSASQYYTSDSAQKESVSVLPSQLIHSEVYETNPTSSVVQDYKYQSQTNEPQQYALSENYPSKDHTIANVIPYRNIAYPAVKPPVPSVQTVSYVTPTPSTKYHSQYNIMVPQTVLKYPSSDKLTQSHSHLSAMHYLQQNHYGHGSNLGYYRGTQYKASSPYKGSYPQGYYTYSKRMTRPSKTIKIKKSDEKISP